jgi:pimeloyl-ACP methyl ester carboxylesterase
MQNFILHKNSKIYFSTKGKGSAIVFLHGFLENSTMWDSVANILSKNNRAICIDLLGHGQTECIGYVHSMENMADAVAAVLKHLRVRKSIVIGHSMGGYVALAFAEKNPKKVKGLCLMNSTSKADDSERKALRARANKMVQTNFESMVRLSFANLFSEQSKTQFKKEMQLALNEALQTPIQGYIACQEGMRIRPNRTGVLKNNDFKKLLIIGKKDPVLNNQELEEEAKETNSDSIIFEEGHMSHIENKEELIDALKQFVK